MTLKNIQLPSLCPWQQKSEKISPRITKNNNIRSWNQQNTFFCENVVYATPSIRKPCIKRSNCQLFHKRIETKRGPGNKVQKTSILIFIFKRMFDMLMFFVIPTSSVLCVRLSRTFVYKIIFFYICEGVDVLVMFYDF